MRRSTYRSIQNKSFCDGNDCEHENEGEGRQNYMRRSVLDMKNRSTAIVIWYERMEKVKKSTAVTAGRLQSSRC